MSSVHAVLLRDDLIESAVNGAKDQRLGSRRDKSFDVRHTPHQKRPRKIQKRKTITIDRELQKIMPVGLIVMGVVTGFEPGRVIVRAAPVSGYIKRAEEFERFEVGQPIYVMVLEHRGGHPVFTRSYGTFIRKLMEQQLEARGVQAPIQQVIRRDKLDTLIMFKAGVSIIGAIREIAQDVSAEVGDRVHLRVKASGSTIEELTAIFEGWPLNVYEEGGSIFVRTSKDTPELRIFVSLASRVVRKKIRVQPA